MSRPLRLNWIACWTVWLLLLWASLAGAQGLSISWSAPEECPSGTVLRERVVLALRQPLGFFDQTTEYRGDVARDASGYRLVLTSQRGSERGTRVIVDRDCNALTSAAALAIALALRASVEEPRPVALAAASGPKRTRAAPPPLPHRRWVGLAVGVQADSGTLPSPSAGVQLALAAGVNRFQAGLRGGALGPISVSRHGKGGRFWLASGQADACWLFVARQRVMLGTCALLEAGRLEGSGTGIDHPRNGSAFWTAAGGRLTSALRLGQSRFSALMAVSGLHSALRRSFVLNGDQQVHRPATVVGRLELGIMQQFR